MKIKALHHEGHPAIQVEDKVYCGSTWCTGTCGLPALTLAHIYECPDLGHRELELKAHGQMVACGPVWQQFRVKWTGQKVPLQSNETLEDLRKMMWW